MIGWKYFFLILGSVAVLVALPYLFKVDQTPHPDFQQEPVEQDLQWGVDSASPATDTLHQCITEHYGTPHIWGRYLGDLEDVSTGLTIDEASFLHARDVKILLIYNLFTDATGYENGKDAAEQAASLAQALHVPQGKAIFANIEPSYPVDDKFLAGWSEGLQNASFTPAIYGSFLPGHELEKAYKRLTKKNEYFRDKIILWTTYPQFGTTLKSEAPKFQPAAPEEALIVGWQYGIDAKNCKIDTNLFTKDMLDHAW